MKYLPLLFLLLSFGVKGQDTSNYSDWKLTREDTIYIEKRDAGLMEIKSYYDNNGKEVIIFSAVLNSSYISLDKISSVSELKYYKELTGSHTFMGGIPESVKHSGEYYFNITLDTGTTTRYFFDAFNMVNAEKIYNNILYKWINYKSSND